VVGLVIKGIREPKQAQSQGKRKKIKDIFTKEKKKY
jgi:hypothetical protein